MTWDESFDIVIIGSGFAGIAAAIEASKKQASLVILEKMPTPGGNSIIDAGEFSVVNSPQQKLLHIKDSAKILAQDMLTNGQFLNDPEKVNFIANQAHDTYLWTTEELGVEYMLGVGFAGGHSVPRAITIKSGSGRELYRKMLSYLQRYHHQPRLNTYVQTIIRRENHGRVLGVRVRENYQFPDKNSGTVKRIRAKKAVLLCYGGFSADVEYRMQYQNNLSAQYTTTNHPGATSELWRESERIGCQLIQANWIQCTPWTNPNEQGFGIAWAFSEYATAEYGLWVNSLGKRFVNENANRKIRADAIFEQESKGLQAIGIANLEATKSLEARRPGYMQQVQERGLVTCHETLEELCQHWHIHYDNLVKQLHTFNQDSKRHIDTEFDRNLRYVRPLLEGPWFATVMSPKVHHCMGGIVTNIYGQAIDAQTLEPISGLYAAGECAGGVHGACRMGACAILDCLVMGRTIGQHSVQNNL